MCGVRKCFIVRLRFMWDSISLSWQANRLGHTAFPSSTKKRFRSQTPRLCLIGGMDQVWTLQWWNGEAVISEHTLLCIQHVPDNETRARRSQRKASVNRFFRCVLNEIIELNLTSILRDYQNRESKSLRDTDQHMWLNFKEPVLITQTAKDYP